MAHATAYQNMVPRLFPDSVCPRQGATVMSLYWNTRGESMDGCVVALYIARAAGAPMLALTTAHLVPGRGIVGDRFYTRRSGAVHDGQSDVTLVEQEALDLLADTGASGESTASARRNIVIRGFPLHQLVGRRFSLGSVTLYGLAPHLTCALP
jgi:hypothetical protein